MTNKPNLIIGVDEAGRGPLAGPLTVAIFVAPVNFRQKLIKVLRGKTKDSKKFSARRRGEIYKEFKRLRKVGKIYFFVSHVSNKVIDRKGITKATALGIKKCLSKLRYLYDRKNIVIRLDGLLKAPEEYKNQKTIIRGDSTDIFIACASIVAKVRRDSLMRRLGKKIPNYQFQIHKGYGTKLHYQSILKFGLSEIHRASFCKLKH